MNFKLLNKKSLALSLCAIAGFPLSVWAVPSSTSPYMTDPQNSHVQDATSDGLSNLNTVLCIMDSMKPADMVNKGNYIALIDMNKCDASNQASTSNATSGSSGATSAPNYMTAIVNVTRASNSDPMIGNMWMSMTQEGQPMDIDVHVTATQSPTDAPPYGQFRADYIGKTAGSSPTTMFNGYVDANGANVTSYESDNHGSPTYSALNLSATTSTDGSGSMSVPDYSGPNPAQKQFNFAYDSSETNFPAGVFRRDTPASDVCFDRSKAAVHTSVWRYGTYNANDGTRVDEANPGFPVQAAYGGNTYWGYASYWGVNFQGLDLNSLGDGQIANLTVTDQRPGNTTTYSLSKNSGKLTKWTQQASTLAAMDGIPFYFWGDLTGQTSDPNVTQGNWEMHWDNTLGKFVVTGQQVCNNGPCTVSSLQSPLTVTGTNFDNMPVAGWSNSFGGNINIPPPVAPATTHAGTDNVYFYTQSDVLPGSTVPALHCLSNCPTAASLQAFTGSNSPYDSATATQWNAGTTTVQYSFGGNGLIDPDGTTALAGLASASAFTGMYQNGVQSGRLYTTALLNSDCPPGMTGYVCEPHNPTSYYTWQTGPNQWSQSMWLTKTSDSSVVSFDPPENIAYTVPASDATHDYGTWAGKTIQLQFNGFGNLDGIPGGCVNPLDNSAVDCSIAGARYVPAFAIPDGATMTLTDPKTNVSTQLIVKALESEVRLNKLDCAATGNLAVSLAQPITPLTLPDATGLHDPSNPGDSDYVGAKPTLTDAPKVIDGVIQ